VSKDRTTEGMGAMAHHGDSESWSLKYDQRSSVIPVRATAIAERPVLAGNPKFIYYNNLLPNYTPSRES
jgi:hypothetical protein